MGKVYALYEDLGVPEGYILLAVCDSLEKAQSVSKGETWTYNATELNWTYQRKETVYPFGTWHRSMPYTCHFVIETYILNDLEALL
jgi:hypothetical protein